MNVTHKGGKLHIDAVNDLDFVLRQIPREIANRQTNLKPTTKVLITLDVDGLVTRTTPFERNSPEGRAAIAAVTKQLVGGEENNFYLNSVTAQQVFNVRVTIKLKYERLDQCDGEKIVEELRKRLEKLKKAGFNSREPQPEGPADPED